MDADEPFRNQRLHEIAPADGHAHCHGDKFYCVDASLVDAAFQAARRLLSDPRIL